VTKNIGDADRTARLLIGAATAFLLFRRRIPGTTGVALALISVFFLATSLLGWCPLYALFRVSTTRASDTAAPKR